MSLSPVLLTCGNPACLAQVRKCDVLKATEIRGQNTHLALSYRCSTCGFQGKAACSYKDWEEAELREEATQGRHKQLVMAGLIELNAVETVNDVVDIWNSMPSPPLLEGRHDACGCSDCLRRLYLES